MLRRALRCQAALAAAHPGTAAWRRLHGAGAGAAPEQPGGILAAYERLLAVGELSPDAAQLAAVRALQLLQQALVLRARGAAAPAPAAAGAAAASSSGGSERSGAALAAAGAPRVAGAYLHGPVGSGKTMLMDLFIATLPAPAGGGGAHTGGGGADTGGGAAAPRPLRVHRLHCHEFMLAAHARLHELQQALPRVVAKSRAGLPVFRYAPPAEDPVLAVAREAAARCEVLALDELHLADVADALLLSRLLSELLDRGTAVVLTSNRPAAHLFSGGGPSRRYVEPLLRLIDGSLLQLRVAGGRDFRERGGAAAPRGGDRAPGAWLVGPGAADALARRWRALAAAHGADGDGAPVSLPLPFGRDLRVPRALPQQPAEGAQAAAAAQAQRPQQPALAAAWFSFEQLAGAGGSRSSLEQSGALSANDCLVLAAQVGALFVDGVPQLGPAQRDEARRLVTLLDCLYDAHALRPGSVRLCVAGAVPPGEVFLPLLGAAAAAGVNPNLGRAAGARLDVARLLREHGPGARADGGGRDELGAAAGEVGGGAASGGGGGGRSALLPEEVLMYHRAASRLAELCEVEECG
ncbi:Afg1l [Scenedesmus sp. PABB004]|nr:Afg1l [Scenedesmus sp. PABB004]